MSDNIFDIKTNNVVELINEADVATTFGEVALASILINPSVAWAKFILTDDLPNANRQRIPQEEFKNLIKSGVYMPLKMKEGSIADGHEEAKPLGVITHLKQVGNQVIGLAALWMKERPADVEYIRSSIGSRPINLSWEILYEDFDIEESGVIALKNTALAGATIVKRPAYEGRTQIIALASKGSVAEDKLLNDDDYFIVKENGEKLFPYRDTLGNVDVESVKSFLASVDSLDLTEQEKEFLKDKANKLLSESSQSGLSSNMEDKTLNELEEIKTQFSELQSELEKRDAKIAELEKQIQDSLSELEQLREFKASVEKEIKERERLEEIKKKFVEAGINKPEEYFTANRDYLLGLDDGWLEFLIQELTAAFSESSVKEKEQKPTIPPITNTNSGKPSISELAEALRNMKR